MSDLIQQAMYESAYTTLAKPVDVEALLVLLNRVLEDRKRGTLRKPNGE